MLVAGGASVHTPLEHSHKLVWLYTNAIVIAYVTTVTNLLTISKTYVTC